MNEELPTTNIGKLPEELKTLKDLIRPLKRQRIVDEFRLKAEAVKWVKEEIEVYGRKETESLKRWMQRLDITEEDLNGLTTRVADQRTEYKTAWCETCEQSTLHYYVGRQYDKKGHTCFDLYNCVLCEGTHSVNISHYWKNHIEGRKNGGRK